MQDRIPIKLAIKISPLVKPLSKLWGAIFIDIQVSNLPMKTKVPKRLKKKQIVSKRFSILFLYFLYYKNKIKYPKLKKRKESSFRFLNLFYLQIIVF
jgi:hypothetical protein